MKTKLAQLICLFNQIDRQHIQLAYIVFTIVGFLIVQSPSDGGTGPVR